MKPIAAWLAMITAETLHGILRALLLVPLVGDLRARQIGVGIGAAIVFSVACLTVRWMGARGTAGWLRVGALWLALTLAFEFTLGWALGLSWDRLISDYDITRGGFMLFGAAALLAAPYVAARIRGVLVR